LLLSPLPICVNPLLLLRIQSKARCLPKLSAAPRVSQALLIFRQLGIFTFPLLLSLFHMCIYHADLRSAKGSANTNTHENTAATKGPPKIKESEQVLFLLQCFAPFFHCCYTVVRLLLHC
jgi:hypothetical protein